MKKALRNRLAGNVTGGEAIKVQSEVEAMETTMIAGIEILLSYGMKLIEYGRVEILLEERKVPRVNIQSMNEHYSDFGLSGPYDPNNRVDMPSFNGDGGNKKCRDYLGDNSIRKMPTTILSVLEDLEKPEQVHTQEEKPEKAQGKRPADPDDVAGDVADETRLLKKRQKIGVS